MLSNIACNSIINTLRPKVNLVTGATYVTLIKWYEERRSHFSFRICSYSRSCQMTIGIYVVPYCKGEFAAQEAVSLSLREQRTRTFLPVDTHWFIGDFLAKNRLHWSFWYFLLDPMNVFRTPFFKTNGDEWIFQKLDSQIISILFLVLRYSCDMTQE